MKWMGGRRGGGGIEDRRGMGGGAMAAGGGGVAVIIAIAAYFLGIDPNTAQKLASQFGGIGSTSSEPGKMGTPEDDAGQFVDVIGGNINDVWKTQLRGYTPPKTVLYEGGTQTACGVGQAAMGPFYCPPDQSVYLDLSFWSQLQQLGGSKADFAKAYVIAHEYGHHIQTLTGASQKVQQAQQAARSEAEGNRYSVALELQADCYAGVWAKRAPEVSSGEVQLDPGEFSEGLKTANAIGDDALMRGAGRSASPEKFTHGTSAQREEWLRKGYDSGDPAVCDGTFAGL